MQRRNDLHQLTNTIQKTIQDAVKTQSSVLAEVQKAKDDRRKKQANPNLLRKDVEEMLVFESQQVQASINASNNFIPEDLIELISRIREEGPKFESDLEFLGSLYFPGIKARHNGIKDAHSNTFEWILMDNPIELEAHLDQPSRTVDNIGMSEMPRKDPYTFSTWLESGSGIFWIHGKPGCGKSTLMKFVCANTTTLQKLRNWSAPKQLATAHYFFWRAGSQLQRTQGGLLRSLIFEMIRGCPDLLPIAKATVPETDEFSDETERWSLEQLLKTYKTMVTQDLETRFCFFIDGLDEYLDSERKPQDLIRTIKELNFSPDVKLCISSRPYPVFDDEFGRDRGRILKVEEHTRGDIRHYVQEKFEGTRYFKKRDPAYRRFVDEVSDRAQGVFLWVVLVVANLEKGIENADSVSELRVRLDSYPPDLDDFFLQMLKNVDAEYRKQAMMTFQLVTTALQPLNVMLLWYVYKIDQDPREINMWKKVQRIQRGVVKEQQNDMRRKIQARSQGLLEVVEDNDHTQAFFKFKVDFIHRTVRDFLSTSDAVKKQFETELKGEPRSSWMIACHAILFVFRAAPFSAFQEEEFLKRLVKDVYFYATKASSDTRRVSHREAEGWVRHAEKLFKQRVLNYTTSQHPQRFFLCLDAQYNFFDALSRRIKQHGALRLNQDGGRPVLDCALVPVPGEGPVRYSEAVVKALLGAGANPRGIVHEVTVWERFLADLVDGKAGSDPQVRQTLVAIVKTILNYDDKCLEALVDTDAGSKSAETILREVFNNAEQAQIRQLKPKVWIKTLWDWI